MGNATRAAIWALLAVLCAVGAWFMLGSNIVFAMCLAGVATALLLIAASCLFRDPPRRPAPRKRREPTMDRESDR